MAIKLRLRGNVSGRWHAADAAAAAPAQPQPQQQQQRSAKSTGGVLSARLRLLELTGNSIRSPFHRCHYAVLLVLTFAALLLGGAIGLPWLLLCCWPTWGLRMLSFTCGGLSSLFDILWLPAAVRAVQERGRQACVRKELQRRLRKELRGLDFAAFYKGKSSAESSSGGISAEGPSGAAFSSGTGSDSGGAAPGSRNAENPQIPEKSRSCLCGGETASQRHQVLQHEQRQGHGRSAGVDESAAKQESAAADESPNPSAARRRSSRLRKQQQRQVPREVAGSRADRSWDSSRSDYIEATRNTGKASTTAAEQQQQQRFAPSAAQERRDWREKLTLAGPATVKEELQRANHFRQQRAAAAAAAAAAANAQRLGVTTLVECRRRAGKAVLTEQDLHQLLREADVESELFAVFARAAGAAAGPDTQSVGGALGCRPCSAVGNRATATADVFTAPRAAAPAAFPPTTCAAGRSKAVSAGGSAESPTVAAAATVAARPPFVGEGHNMVTQEECCSSKPRIPVGGRAAKACSPSSSSSSYSSSSTAAAAESLGGSASGASAACPVRCDDCAADGASRPGNGVQPGSGVGGSSQDTPSEGNSSSAARGGEGGGGGEGLVGAGDRREEKRSRCWTCSIPWELIFRGLLAHCECTYLVDLLFCHAELSPLSSSIQRELLLLLHCLVRGLTVFLAFASPYCYTPYSHRLRTSQLLSSLCICISGSFGAAACMLMAPLLVVELLQPLLRLLRLPDAVVKSDLLMLLTDARLALPSVSLSYEGNTWSTRANFYAISQLLTLAVVSAGAYAAVRLYDAEARVAAAAKRVYATDVLALLALKKRQETARDEAWGAASATRAAENHGSLAAGGDVGKVRVGGEHRPESTAAPVTEGRDEEVKATARAGRGLAAAGESQTSDTFGGNSVDEGPTRREDKVPTISEPGEESGARSEQRQQQEEVLQSAGWHRESTPGQTAEEQLQSEREQGKFGEDERLNLLLAEKVVEERFLLEASDFELLRARVVRRLLHIGGAVATCCLLLCWTAVALLAVSNVAMRMNTPSDIFQERENARLMSAAAAAASLLDEQTVGGFKELAEEMRLLQEELRDVMNYYTRIQRQQGWLAATADLWEKLGEEFAAAREARTTQRKQELSAYAILGVKPTATGADIKKAYKLLAKQLHPDLLAAAASHKSTTPEELDAATERMRKINAAYEKLMRKHGGRGGRSY